MRRTLIDDSLVAGFAIRAQAVGFFFFLFFLGSVALWLGGKTKI